MLQNRISVVACFSEQGISLLSQQHRVRTIDADKPQLGQGLSDGIGVVAHIGRKRHNRIAGALAYAPDASGGVAVKNSAVLCESDLSGGVLGRLPIGIARAPLDIVNSVAGEFEWR